MTIAEVRQSAGLPEVMPAYLKALSYAKNDPELLVRLAHQFERTGEFEKALELVSQVDADSDHIHRARLVESRVLKRDKQMPQAKEILEKLVKELPEQEELRLEAVGDLALIHDREGDFDEAFRMMTSIKQVHLSRCASQKAASDFATQRFAVLADSLTDRDFTRWADELEDRAYEPTPALLTGFPRSGTTLMEQVLDAHPQIVSTEEKDLMAREILPSIHGKLSAEHSLLEVLDQISHATVEKKRKFVWSAFETLSGQSLGGMTHVDKNPAYNLLIPLYLRLFPETKLLIALRDPRDVLLSCYLRYLPLNPVSVTFLTLESTAHRYALDMTAWLKFSEMISNPWVEVRYEDMVGNMEVEARKICQTLGLEWHDDILRYREKLQHKQVTSPTYADVKKPIYKRSLNRWKNYEKHLEPQFETLAPFLEAYGYD
ncbi:hypothetical protein NT6N_10440 [Oceaniferula spumae]|uniref:Sulfotransferase family protein n=1 Tax=Oceaniferula spumae TaxID=2979115 RepID=A0AAT9FJ53_9BACT